MDAATAGPRGSGPGERGLRGQRRRAAMTTMIEDRPIEPTSVPTLASSRRRSRLLALGAAIVVVVLGAVTVRVLAQPARPPLGDAGAVTATASADCASLEFTNRYGEFRGIGGVPVEARGRQVGGRLVVDERRPNSSGWSATGRFVADDGWTVPVTGGSGDQAWPVPCAIYQGAAA